MVNVLLLVFGNNRLISISVKLVNVLLPSGSTMVTVLDATDNDEQCILLDRCVLNNTHDRRNEHPASHRHINIRRCPVVDCFDMFHC
jgi:hypothetical protein